MTLQEQIDRAWKEAMKARDPKKDALGLIRTELKNYAIATRAAGEQGTALDDDKALEVLSKMAKQRRESIAEYKKGGRDDLVKKETLELEVIESFLPKPLTKEELEQLVADAVAETGASSMKEMGKVMSAVMPKVKGRADGKEVQALVKAKLGG